MEMSGIKLWLPLEHELDSWGCPPFWELEQVSQHLPVKHQLFLNGASYQTLKTLAHSREHSERCVMLCNHCRGDDSCSAWKKRISMEEGIKDWESVIDPCHVGKQQRTSQAPVPLTWCHLCRMGLRMSPMACAVGWCSGMASIIPLGTHALLPDVLVFPITTLVKEGCAAGHTDAMGTLGRGHWCPHFTLLRLLEDDEKRQVADCCPRQQSCSVFCL